MCPGDFGDVPSDDIVSLDMHNCAESDLDKQVNKYVIVIFAYRIVQ